MKHPSWLRVILFLLLYNVFFPLVYGQENHPPRLREVLPIGTSDWLSPCAKFEDAPNRDEIEISFVLYRDLLKAKEWKQAFTYWEKVHAAAPAADGRRATVYIDGIRLYRQFYKLSQDSLEKEQYVDRIFELYDEMGNCYPSLENIPARKAFDLSHKYPHRATKAEIFQLCKNVLDGEPSRVPAYIMLPATELLIRLYQDGLLAKEEARIYVSKLVKILPIGLEQSVGAYQRQQWSHSAENIRMKLLVLEQEQGFYDCSYFLDKYYEPILDNTSLDCDRLFEAYSVFRKVGCLDLEQKKMLFGKLKSFCCAMGLNFTDWYR